MRDPRLDRVRKIVGEDEFERPSRSEAMPALISGQAFLQRRAKSQKEKTPVNDFPPAREDETTREAIARRERGAWTREDEEKARQTTMRERIASKIFPSTDPIDDMRQPMVSGIGREDGTVDIQVTDPLEDVANDQIARMAQTGIMESAITVPILTAQEIMMNVPKIAVGAVDTIMKVAEDIMDERARTERMMRSKVLPIYQKVEDGTYDTYNEAYQAEVIDKKIRVFEPVIEKITQPILGNITEWQQDLKEQLVKETGGGAHSIGLWEAISTIGEMYVRIKAMQALTSFKFSGATGVKAGELSRTMQVAERVGGIDPSVTKGVAALPMLKSRLTELAKMKDASNWHLMARQAASVAKSSPVFAALTPTEGTEWDWNDYARRTGRSAAFLGTTVFSPWFGAIAENPVGAKALTVTADFLGNMFLSHIFGEFDDAESVAYQEALRLGLDEKEALTLERWGKAAIVAINAFYAGKTAPWQMQRDRVSKIYEGARETVEIFERGQGQIERNMIQAAENIKAVEMKHYDDRIEELTRTKNIDSLQTQKEIADAREARAAAESRTPEDVIARLDAAGREGQDAEQIRESMIQEVREMRDNAQRLEARVAANETAKIRHAAEERELKWIESAKIPNALTGKSRITDKRASHKTLLDYKERGGEAAAKAFERFRDMVESRVGKELYKKSDKQVVKIALDEAKTASNFGKLYNEPLQDFRKAIQRGLSDLLETETARINFRDEHGVSAANELRQTAEIMERALPKREQAVLRQIEQMRQERVEAAKTISEYAKQYSSIKNFGTEHSEAYDVIAGLRRKVEARLDEVGESVTMEAIDREVVGMLERGEYGTVSDAGRQVLDGLLRPAEVDAVGERVKRTTISQQLESGSYPIMFALSSEPIRTKGRREVGGEYDDAITRSEAGGLFNRLFSARDTTAPIDVRAQDLYERGLIDDPYPDTLWKAIRDEMYAFRKERETGYRQANFWDEAERVDLERVDRAIREGKAIDVNQDVMVDGDDSRFYSIIRVNVDPDNRVSYDIRNEQGETFDRVDAERVEWIPKETGDALERSLDFFDNIGEIRDADTRTDQDARERESGARDGIVPAEGAARAGVELRGIEERGEAEIRDERPPAKELAVERINTFADEVESITRGFFQDKMEKRLERELKKIAPELTKGADYLASMLGEVKRVSENIAKERTEQILGKLSDDDSRDMFDWLFARMTGGELPQLRDDLLEKVAPIDSLFAEYMPRVKQATEDAGKPFNPVPEGYFPAVPSGTPIGRHAALIAKTPEKLLNILDDPFAIHDRDLGPLNRYRRDAKANLRDYIFAMESFIALHSGDGAAQNIHNSLRAFSDMVNSPAVIDARAAWHKAQDEGREAASNKERLGQKIDEHIDKAKVAVEKEGLRIPGDLMLLDRETNDLRAEWAAHLRENGGVPLTLLDIEVVNPAVLRSKEDGQPRKALGELGPSQKFWQYIQDRVASLTDKSLELIRPIVGKEGILQEIYGKNYESIRENRELNKRLTAIYEYAKANALFMNERSPEDYASAVNEFAKNVGRFRSESGVLKLNIKGVEVSEADVRAYVRINQQLEKMVTDHADDYEKLRRVKGVVYRSPRYSKSRASRSYLDMAEVIKDRTAHAAMLGDAVEQSLAIAKMYRSMGRDFYYNAQYWERYAKEGLAHGLHPIDAAMAKKSIMTIAKHNKLLGKGTVGERALTETGEIALTGMQYSSRFLATRFLAGNWKWSLTRQPLSMFMVLPQTGYVALARGLQGIAEYTFAPAIREGRFSQTKTGQEILRRVEERGLPEKTASLKTKRSEKGGITGAEFDFREAQLVHEYLPRVNAYMNRMAEAIEFSTGVGSYFMANAEADRLGMTGDRKRYYRDQVIATTQSMYNRESRALLLNSQFVRFFAPFQTFAADVLSNAMDVIRSDEDAADRAMWVVRGSMALALMDWFSQIMYGRDAYRSVAGLTPFIGQYLEAQQRVSARGLMGLFPIAGKLDDTLVQGFSEWIKNSDARQLARELPPDVMAAFGIHGAQLTRDGIAVVQTVMNHGYFPAKANQDEQFVIDPREILAFWEDIGHFMLLNARDTPTARRQQERQSEIDKRRR